MALHITNPETEQAVRRLAELTGTTLSEAVRQAVEAALEQKRQTLPVEARLQPIWEKLDRLGRADGPAASKAFFDRLWED